MQKDWQRVVDAAIDQGWRAGGLAVESPERHVDRDDPRHAERLASDSQQHRSDATLRRVRVAAATDEVRR